MSDVNNNKIIKKTYNPKAHAPSVYIPCWLIQVPVSLLSYQAKLLYGRLAQWANEAGKVFRSVPQLSEELGCSKSTVDRTIKELKDVGLIGTFHPKAGGINHFEFYDHAWMYDPIKEQLSYKESKPDPTSDVTLPHVRCDVTPTSDVTCINIKEIKQIISKDICTYKKKEKKDSFSLNDMLEDNPFDIEKSLIEDWIKVRSRKRAAITSTAWKQLNKHLEVIQNTKSFTAIDAFTKMVSKGWLSVDPEWFDAKIQTDNSKAHYNDESWGKDFYSSNSLGL
jgi:hypothetical protein